MTSRPATGRARNDAAHREILAAALSLAREGLGTATVDAIAARAGVGKQTIYRWWPSKAAVVLEALVTDAAVLVPVRTTGPLQDDLALFLRATFDAVTRPGGTGPVLRVMMAAAQDDAELARQWREQFIVPRREALLAVVDAAAARGEIPPPDRALLADLAFGGLWYRLLVGHAPLDPAYADAVAAAVTRAARHP